MLSAADGYVLTENSQLFWTSTGGITWESRTPSIVHGGARIAALSHLDSYHLWLLIQTPQGIDTGYVSISIGSTSDRGRSWRISPVLIQDRDLLYSAAGGQYISFADTSHGWFELRYPDNTQWSRGGLFATSDGGKTWTRLPNPPILDKMEFTSAQTGWLAGGVDPWHRLFQTSDGGFHWVERTVPFPGPKDDYQRELGLPHFEEHTAFLIAGDDNLKKEGVKFVDGTWEVHSGFAWDIYKSTDGGITWSGVPQNPKMIENPRAFTFFAGSDLMQILPSSDSIVTRYNATVMHAECPVHLPSARATVVDASFVDPMHGWVIVFAADCGSPYGCKPGTALLSTHDGGATFFDITPAE